jgi:hypothetical protein
MNTRRSLVIAGLITLASAVYSALMASKLPEIVPAHRGLNGQPDAYGSKWVPLLLMPGIGPRLLEASLIYLESDDRSPHFL